MSIPLAQLSDIMTHSQWIIFYVSGIGLPIAGLTASALMRSIRIWKLTLVGAFYLFTLPVAAIAFSGNLDSNAFGCGFLIAMPVGILLGLIVLLPTKRPGAIRSTPRGFEVTPVEKGE